MMRSIARLALIASTSAGYSLLAMDLSEVPVADDVVAIDPAYELIGPFGRPAAWADMRGLAISAYIDAIAEVADREADVPGQDGDEGTSIDWRTGAEIEFRSRIGATIQLIGEVRFSTGREQDGSGTNEEDELDFQQAMVRYQADHDLAFTAGRFHQWFGWERFDAPELWRINRTFTYYNSGNLDGVGVHWSFANDWELHGYVVNEIITPRDSADTKNNADLGYGTSLRWRPDDDALIKLEGYYDVDTTTNVVTDRPDSVWTVTFNGEWITMADSNISLSWDFAYGDNPNGWQFFALGAGRFDWEHPDTPGFCVNHDQLF